MRKISYTSVVYDRMKNIFICRCVPNDSIEPAPPTYDIKIESKLSEISSIPLTEDIADQFYQLILEKAKLVGKEPYDFLMDYLKSIEKPKITLRSEAKIATGTRVEYPVHHMFPQYEGGPDTDENKVVVTRLEHAIAHYVRWRDLGKRQDRAPFSFFIGQKAQGVALVEEIRLANLRIAHQKRFAKDKIAGLNMFDKGKARAWGKMGGLIGGKLGSKADKIRAGRMGGLIGGKIGGPIGGKMGSKLGKSMGGKLGSKADKIRAGKMGGKLGGKKGGRLAGISKQKPEVKAFLSTYTIWFYCNKKLDQEIYFLMSPHIALVDVGRILNEQSGVSSIKQSNHLSRTISGAAKQAYGWTPLKTFTFNEVKMGVDNWIIENPDKTLIMESGLDLKVL